MTHATQPTDEPDMPLVHDFIRIFGRKPKPGELSTYQRARARMALRRPGGLRRRAARLIVRL
jgi:hypothetical protein